MSKFRQFPNLQVCSTFGETIRCLLRFAAHVYERDLIHEFLYYCMNPSTKDGEHMRQAGEYGTIRIIDFDEAVPIPQQLENIWPSSANKK